MGTLLGFCHIGVVCLLVLLCCEPSFAVSSKQKQNKTVGLRIPPPPEPPAPQHIHHCDVSTSVCDDNPSSEAIVDDGKPSSSNISTSFFASSHEQLSLLLTILLVSAASATLLLVGILFSSSHVHSAAYAQWKYWRVLVFLLRGGGYDNVPFFRDDLHAKTHLLSFVMMVHMWDSPHYRSGTFRNDMVKNLRNVAFPGTGIPLSLLCMNKIVLLSFLFVGYPILCLAYAFLCSKKKTIENIASLHTAYLIHPSEWFFFWRTNCVVASLHALITNTPGYDMEDKFTFLVEGEARDIPVSPFLKTSGIVCKDRNEEGGMGIHVFKNATHNGAWIVQEMLSNAESIDQWLPDNAPLSTFRVITSSTHAYDIVNSCSEDTDHRNANKADEHRDAVRALSCVWRAGRENAHTDHSSILFDVDIETGRIGDGTTNAHWYQLGIHNGLFKYQPAPSFTAHPDNGCTITGALVPDINAIKEIACSAHAKMLPDVPLCGWDVALTKEHNMCLLEVNLSCNFFNGSFDKRNYFEYIDRFYSKLQPLLPENKALQ